MPLLRDRVRETTTTVGTGTITLGGAVTGYQSFNTAFTNGDTTYYVIQGGTEWEIGIGTIGAGTLARTTVLQSSNADALVPFAAGTKDVFCSYVADRAVTTSDAATLTNKTLDDYTNNVGANSTHFRIKATGTISKGQVVKATGFNPGESAIEVAVVTSATDLALGIAEQALTAGQFGLAVVIGELFDVNTNGLSVGAIIYSNGTGGYTTTKPSSGTYQPLGWVVRANLNNGVIAVNIVAPLYVETSTNTANTAVLRDGSGNFAAGTITATLNGAAPAGSLTGTTLASNVVSSSLTSVGTLSSLTVSGTISGGSPISTTAAVGSAALRLNSTNANTAARNWAVASNVSAYGDFAILQSTAQNGDPLGAGTIRQYIDTNGNVGIGTTTPIAQLSNTNTTDTISSTNASGFAWRSTANEWAGVVISRPASGLSYGLRVHTGGTTASDYPLSISSGASGGTTLAVVTGAGNVGIGTTTPAYRLDVQNTGNTLARVGGSGTGQAGFYVASGGAFAPFILFQSSGTTTEAGINAPPGTGSLVFTTGALSTSRWTINSSGHFLAATDASFDLGASGANRPRDGFFSNNVLASNRVGAGTTAPEGPLHGLNFQGSRQLIIERTGSNSAKYAFTASANSLTIRDDAQAVDRAVIDGSGNLGLGVTPSAWGAGGKALQFADVARIVSAGTGMEVGSNWYNDGAGYRYTTTAAVSLYAANSGTHAWYIAPSGTAGNAISFTQAMTLDASGNLGIGVTAPAQILDIARSINGNAIASIVNSNTGTAAAAYYGVSNGTSSTNYIHLGTAYTTVGAFEANSGGLWAVGANGGFMVASNATGSLRFATGGYTTRWSINSSGHFLAGADATYDIGASGANRVRNVFVATSVTTPSVTNAGTLALSATGANVITMATNGTERARVTSAGYFKASDTGIYINSTATYHELVNSATSTVLAVRNSSASFNQDALYVDATRNTTNNTFYAISYYNGGAAAYRFRVADSGDVTNTNGSYTAISDAKLKQDIIDAPSQWDDIKAVRFRKYRFKDAVATDPTAPYLLGVVAQELEQTSPGCIDQHIDRDANGNELGTVTKSFKQSVLLMKAAVALQEAMARIEVLEAKVAQLTTP